MVRTAVALLFSARCIGLPAGRSLAAAPRAQAAPVNAHAQAMVEFKKRVDGYLELRKAVTQKHPEVKETGNPAKIHEREVNLGKGIAMARANAKAGDLFGPVSRQLLTIVDPLGASEGADTQGQSAVPAQHSAGQRAVEAAGAAADAAGGAGVPPGGPPAAATRSRCQCDRGCTGRSGANQSRMTLCA